MTTTGRLVVDASALVDAVLRPDAVGDVARDVVLNAQCHAPHLADAEVGSVLRRLVLRRQLDAEVAEQRLSQAQRLIDVRHELVGPLSGAAWRLRDTISFYDGLYVALAVGLDRPLVTSDAKLAAAARHHCEVLLLGRDAVT